jgi:dephospho-CoA kinase
MFLTLVQSCFRLPKYDSTQFEGILMLWIGLTGGIGMGKSTVAQIFRDLGVPVIDADQISLDLTGPGTSSLREIVKVFGRSVLDDAGKLDRKKMANIVFNNPQELKKLEDILHPKVREEVQNRKKELEGQGFQYAIYDVPLLFEKNLSSQFDKVISVLTDAQTQVERIQSRNKNWDGKEIHRRIQTQVAPETKRKKSDFVIDNSTTQEDLKKAVIEVNIQLKQIAKTQ